MAWRQRPPLADAAPIRWLVGSTTSPRTVQAWERQRRSGEEGPHSTASDRPIPGLLAEFYASAYTEASASEPVWKGPVLRSAQGTPGELTIESGGPAASATTS